MSFILYNQDSFTLIPDAQVLPIKGGQSDKIYLAIAYRYT